MSEELKNKFYNLEESVSYEITKLQERIRDQDDSMSIMSKKIEHLEKAIQDIKNAFDMKKKNVDDGGVLTFAILEAYNLLF